MILKRFLLLLAVPLALQASSVFAATTTFYFNGVCLDCNLDSGNGLIATLVLEDYTQGDPIESDDLVSFDYIGSNLVYPVTVTSDDFPYVDGNIGSTLDAPYDFYIDWEDGLRFSASSNGDWYVCANGPSGYYSGSCDIFINNDYGTGTWSQTPGNVPLPAAAWLFMSALSGLLVAKRRSQKA